MITCGAWSVSGMVRWAAGGNRREQYKISSILFSPTLHYDKTKFNYKDFNGDTTLRSVS